MRRREFISLLGGAATASVIWPLAASAAIIPLGIVLFHKPIELRPWNTLQKVTKNDILPLHGVDPFGSR